MKKWKWIVAVASTLLLLSGSMSAFAAEKPGVRSNTDRSEVIGTAVVVKEGESGCCGQAFL